MYFRKSDGVKTVVFIITAFRRGGAERLVAQLADEVAARGITPLIVGHKVSPPTNERDWFCDSYNRCSPTSNKFFSRARLLVSVLRNNNVTAVHTHSYLNDWFYLLICVIFRVKHRVVTVHNTHYPRNITAKIKSIVFEWIAYVCCTARISVSQSVQNHDLKRLKLPILKQHVILNGVDTSKLMQWSKPISSDEIELVSIGHCSKQKNHLELLEFLNWCRINDRDLFEKIHIRILGKVGDFGASTMVEAEKMNLADRVKFEGQTENVEDYLADAHLLIQPSLWEGLPLAVIEAVVFGIPVIASKIPPHEELRSYSGNRILTYRHRDFASLRSMLVQGAQSGTIPDPGAMFFKLFDLRRMLCSYATHYGI